MYELNNLAFPRFIKNPWSKSRNTLRNNLQITVAVLSIILYRHYFLFSGGKWEGFLRWKILVLVIIVWNTRAHFRIAAGPRGENAMIIFFPLQRKWEPSLLKVIWFLYFIRISLLTPETFFLFGWVDGWRLFGSLNLLIIICYIL